MVDLRSISRNWILLLVFFPLAPWHGIALVLVLLEFLSFLCVWALFFCVCSFAQSLLFGSGWMFSFRGRFLPFSLENRCKEGINIIYHNGFVARGTFPIDGPRFYSLGGFVSLLF